ncbi:cobalamin-binding protein [Halopenitus sp. H-Gu1]|uniref:cobalamin-binding protein n=1 Tax=Halopenitus sp. H-Gu1 TaxID=3242697 RepID=UPI00359CDC38
MDSPRVVSLAPSATATITALGASDRLVGVTHHCAVESGQSPVSVGGWMTPDLDRIDQLDPDVVLTSDGLQAEIAEELRQRDHHVIHHEPASLAEVVASFADVGAAIGRPDAGERLVENARDRIDVVSGTVAERLERSDQSRPVVYCEEWMDPPMAAGNWVPDVVRTAGGQYPFVDPGERSREIDEETVRSHDPDHVVLHPCGYGDRVDPSVVHDRGWDLDAEVHVLNDDLLNQPSPNLLAGIEQLAETLHPEAFREE